MPTPNATRPRPPLMLIGLALLVAAAGSLALMFRAGHPPRFLLLLFTGWVLSPFVGLVAAQIWSRSWSATIRTTLHVVTLIVAVGSLLAYGKVVPMPAGTKPAFLFLVVPLVSWALLLALVPLSALFASRARLHRQSHN